MNFFASCLPGLEPVLHAELEEHGIGSGLVVTAGGVEFEGTLEDMVRANRELGVAQQVRARIATFHASKLPELARKSLAVPFKDWLTKDTPLRIRVRSRKSKLYHTGAIAERVQRAVVAQIGEFEEGDGQQLLIRVDKNEVTMSVDTSGEPLHRRGYRLATGKAPLREDLACALLRVSGWDRKSTLVDPMMGAGTIVIEAAQLALGLAPGRNRSFAFASMPIAKTLPPQMLSAHVVSPESSAHPPPIFGSDRDKGVIESARENAERAGVADFVNLGESPFSVAPGLDREEGTLVTNPPYGKRVGGKDLRPLYQKLGRLLADHPSWNFACVSPDKSLPRQMKTNLKSALMTDHGGLKVRFWTHRRDQDRASPGG